MSAGMELATRHVDRRERQALLGVLHQPLLEDGSVLGKLVRMAGDHQEPAREPDDLRHVAHIRAVRLDAGARRA